MSEERTKYEVSPQAQARYDSLDNPKEWHIFSRDGEIQEASYGDQRPCPEHNTLWGGIWAEVSYRDRKAGSHYGVNYPGSKYWYIEVHATRTDRPRKQLVWTSRGHSFEEALEKAKGFVAEAEVFMEQGES